MKVVFQGTARNLSKAELAWRISIKPPMEALEQRYRDWIVTYDPRSERFVALNFKYPLSDDGTAGTDWIGAPDLGMLESLMKAVERGTPWTSERHFDFEPHA